MKEVQRDPQWLEAEKVKIHFTMKENVTSDKH